MNILVTGGCGFIGSNFIRNLLLSAKQHQIVNVDKLTYAGNVANLADFKKDARYHFIKADIGNTKIISTLLREHKIQTVINFAAETHVDRSIDSPEPFFQTNVISTLRLLDACRKHWAALGNKQKNDFRFLHVSTDEVYGTLQPKEAAFTETTPYKPNSPYAASKASSDFIVRSFYHTYGLPTIITNCSNNYGPCQFPEKLIPLTILNALDGKPLPIYGDGKQVRDWLYVEDHAQALWKILKDGKIGETYNIGGNCEKTNIEVVSTICDLLDLLAPRLNGKSYHELKKFVQDRPGHDKRYAINSTKLSKELGWKPLENFKSGLEKTVLWYIKNDQWAAKITRRIYNRKRLGLI